MTGILERAFIIDEKGKIIPYMLEDELSDGVITSVSDTPEIDLDVTGGNLTATIGAIPQSKVTNLVDDLQDILDDSIAYAISLGGMA